MNDSIIVISGMILLMAPIAYDHPSKNTTIHAAVAVNASNPKSAYGIEIPEHFASLLLPGKGNLKTNAGDRLVEVDANHTKLDLHGDLVQLGTFDGTSVCTAITDHPSDTMHPTIANSIKALPRMADLVDDVDKRKLWDDTHPDVNGKFVDVVNPDRVAAWMEIPLGRLSAVHSGSPEADEVMFLPLHRNAMMAQGVRWHVLDKADCVLVTPFKNGAPVYVSFNSGNVSMTYQNKAEEHSGEVMPGVGFDFEVLYSLFVVTPTMPPIPLSVGLMSQGSTPMNHSAGTSLQGNGLHRKNSTAGAKQKSETHQFDPNTGVNCGPATIPSGG